VKAAVGDTMESQNTSLLLVNSQDVKAAKLQTQQRESPRGFLGLGNAINSVFKRVQGRASKCEEVSFSSLSIPCLTEQLPYKRKKAHQRYLRSDFVLRGRLVLEPASSSWKSRGSGDRSRKPALVNRVAEDGLADEEDDDDIDVDEYDDVSSLSWNMLSSSGSPVRAEPVTCVLLLLLFTYITIH
jgi:hypothetical protein